MRLGRIDKIIGHKRDGLTGITVGFRGDAMKIDTLGCRMSTSMWLNSIGIKTQSLAVDDRGVEESRRGEFSQILKYRDRRIL